MSGFLVKQRTGFCDYYLMASGAFHPLKALAQVFPSRKAAEDEVVAICRKLQYPPVIPPEVEEVRRSLLMTKKNT